MMEISLGCFGNLEDISAIESAGFQHAELDVQDVMNLSDDAFEQLAETIGRSALSCDVFNTMIPVTIPIPVYSPAFDFDYWCSFQWEAAKKTRRLGARCWILANGENRRLPCKGDIASAKEKVHEFIRAACCAAAAYGITVLIEPLSSAYTNYLQNLAETVELIDRLGVPNLSTMADIRHMLSEGEPLSEIVRFKQYVRHIHIDNPMHRERYFPKQGDGFSYEPLFHILKEADYHGILSAEGRYYMQGPARGEFAREAKLARHYLESLIAQCC